MQQFDSAPLTEFVALCAKRFCPGCGEAIIPNTNGRPKKFCSDKCRWAYWKRRYRQREKEERIHEHSNTEGDPSDGVETGCVQPQEEAEAG